MIMACLVEGSAMIYCHVEVAVSKVGWIVDWAISKKC